MKIVSGENGDMKVVVSAGGKGTRISSVASTIPKPMISICGKPVLERQVECLRRQGFRDFIFTVGHLGQQIQDYFGDGSRFGVTITYYVEREPLGTAGALVALREQLKEDYLLINGDLIFDVDIGRMIRFHQQKNAAATLLTHPNSHPYDGAVIEADKDHRIIRWLNKEEDRGLYENRVNSGIHILSPRLFDRFTKVERIDLDREVLKPRIPEGDVFSYDSPEYIHDMGTPERYRQVCEAVKNGLPARRNLSRPQKAIFLDRDGTINVHKGFVTRWEQIELLPGAAEAIARINQSGYLAIVVTNQPVIARGECTWEELWDIHRVLQMKLGEKGAYLDDILICPHHPDKGFPGERSEYKIDCSCRKPKPGLLLEAAKKYNIDLTQSYMVGDSERDTLAGEAAGCRSVRIGESGRFESLSAFINTLFDYEKS